MHRNTYINSPNIVNRYYQFISHPNIFVAGQISGVEGYVESAATGIIAAINLWRKEEGKEFVQAPRCSVIGSLLDYILHAASSKFEPMNANWAIVPDSAKEKREQAISKALQEIESYWRDANE
jgi:methylenetetrahydrofolate--tRNA-(uracil-5-)-methyltransferase